MISVSGKVQSGLNKMCNVELEIVAVNATDRFGNTGEESKGTFSAKVEINKTSGEREADHKLIVAYVIFNNYEIQNNDILVYENVRYKINSLNDYRLDNVIQYFKVEGEEKNG